MAGLLAWLEGSALGEAVRDAGVWSYAVINLAHILGIATLFGSVLLLDLRLLGFFARVPLTVIARPTVPLAAAGLGLAALSGLSMLATNATEYQANPFLRVKLGAIAVALVNVLVVRRLPAWRSAEASTHPTPRQQKQLALGGAISLLAWLTAVTAGRMMGYW